MTGPIFDTHAHYSARAFDADRDFLLDSLPGKGVVGVCEQATQLSSEDHQSVSGFCEGSPLPAVPCSVPVSVLEEEELLPNRPLHQSPPVVLSLGASGSGAGSGPALTTMFTRPFSFVVEPAAGF